MKYSQLVRVFSCSDCRLCNISDLHTESAECLSCGKLLYTYETQTLVETIKNPFKEITNNVQATAETLCNN